MHRSTSRLLLRAPVATDLARVFAIYGDPATHEFNPFGPLRDITQAQSLLEAWLRHWHEKGYGQWAVACLDAPELIIGFGGIDARMYLEVEQVNLGYRFATSAWGKGYATELSEAALAYAFDELHLPQVFAVVRPGHLASIRVLEKVGMQRIDTLDDIPGQAASLVYRACPQTESVITSASAG